MNALEQIREGFSRAVDTLAEGWRHLQERASHALTRFTPTHATGELETDEDRTAARGARWGLLAAEVKDTDKAVEVRIEIPGMNAEDFDIEVRDRVLVVSGEKRVEREETQGRYHVMERAYGHFQRVVPLPADVDESKAEATYRKGVLTVRLPKKRRASAQRRIRVASD